MIAVDTNILVYAHREDSPFHAEASSCLARLAHGRDAWGLPWPCVHEFFSIATHPKIYAPPSPLPRAVDQIDAWLESPTLVMLGETELHWAELRGLLLGSRITGPMVHDARIAALCRRHGVTVLLTADRDFSRFPTLKTRNPLVGG